MLAKPCAGDALALTLKNDLAEIAPVALLVAELGARHAVPEATVSHFNLALDEAISNIVLHAFDDAGAHEIGVRISLIEGILRAELVDDGRAFDPREVAAPDLAAPLEERPVGGLGIHL